MKKGIFVVTVGLFISVFLTACTWSQNKNAQSSYCKELKNRMLMNGATGNQTLAQQQRVENQRLTTTYRDECS